MDNLKYNAQAQTLPELLAILKEFIAKHEQIEVKVEETAPTPVQKPKKIKKEAPQEVQETTEPPTQEPQEPQTEIIEVQPQEPQENLLKTLGDVAKALGKKLLAQTEGTKEDIEKVRKTVKAIIALHHPEGKEAMLEVPIQHHKALLKDLEEPSAEEDFYDIVIEEDEEDDFDF